MWNSSEDHRLIKSRPIVGLECRAKKKLPPQGFLLTGQNEMGKVHFLKNYTVNRLQLLRHHCKHKTVNFCDDDDLGGDQIFHMKKYQG